MIKRSSRLEPQSAIIHIFNYVTVPKHTENVTIRILRGKIGAKSDIPNL